MSLATFYMLFAEIFTIYLGYCILIVSFLITNETSGIEFISEDFFLLCYNLIEKAEEMGDVRGVLNGFPYW